MDYMEAYRARNSRVLELPFSFIKFCILFWLCATLYLQLRAFHYANTPLLRASIIPASSLHLLDQVDVDVSSSSSKQSGGKSAASMLGSVQKWDDASRRRLTQDDEIRALMGRSGSAGLSRSVLNAFEGGTDVNLLESRSAYVVVITKCSLVEPALVLAQNLRFAGCKADLVLILTAAECTSDDRLPLHFTNVTIAEEVENRYESKGFNKLLAWKLTNYSKVLYLDVDVLPLVNLDHLFSHPTPAMAPDVYAATKFNSGIMLLEPSDAVFRDMTNQLDHLSSYNGGDQGFLNAYFSDWYSLPYEHRLPAGYNSVLFFPDYYHPPAWFDLNSPKSFFGPIKIVHFANPWFKPWMEGATVEDGKPSQAVTNIWASTWQRTKQLLQVNGWKPFTVAIDYPPEEVKAFTVQDRHVGNTIVPSTKAIYPPAPKWESSVREAFITVATSEEDVLAAGVFAYSYNLQHKAAQIERPLILLVLRSVSREYWAPFKGLFTKVRIVDPIVDDVEQGQGQNVWKAFTVLHIWNQTRFDKLVYMDPYSLAADNCYGLLEYRAFAATPSLLPPDSFSSRVMVVQPHSATFAELVKQVKEFKCSLGDPHSCLEEFLNFYYSDWYSRPAAHRISLSYAVDGWFKQGLMSYLSPWRSLAFDRRAVPWSRAIREDRVIDRFESSVQWVNAFCSLSYKQRNTFPKLAFRFCTKRKKNHSSS